MSESFFQILQEHTKRYPQMQPQDYGKLIYQSEFGPEHMIKDVPYALTLLREENAALMGESSPKTAEAIGGNLCRFPVSACQNPAAEQLLIDLFALTAKKHRGTMEGLLEKLEQTERLKILDMEEWGREWKENGCPPVHHSATYRAAYQPHYRLLKKEYAGYFSLLLSLRTLVESKKQLLIGIDGRCGSGKTNLATLLEELFCCNCIHMDDFYLPIQKREKNWKEILGGNIDFARLQEEIFTPVKEGRQITYRPYSCEKGEITKEVSLPPQPLTIVEGSYSHHPLLAAQYDLKIFLTCPKDEQVRRLKMREKDYFPVFEAQWMPLEENYFKCFSVESGSDFLIDTGWLF